MTTFASRTATQLKQEMAQIDELELAISKLIKDHGASSQVTAGLLCDLLAMMVASVPPDQRYDAHLMLLKYLDDLIPAHVDRLIKLGHVPPDWLKGTRS